MLCAYIDEHDENVRECHMAYVAGVSPNTDSDVLTDKFVDNNLIDAFASVADEEDDMYPVTVSEIAEAQRSDKILKTIFNPAQSA